ncbi:MAG: MFS transporter, partial [Chloroflexota bacterium]
AGLAVLPLSASVFIGAPLSANLVRRIGARNTVMLGAVLAACGSAIVFFWTDHSPSPVLFVTFVLLGLGIGFGMTPSTSAILDTLPPKQAGIASAVNDVTRDFGQSMGIAIMGSLASVTYAKVLASGYESLSPEQQAQIPKDIAIQIQSSLAGAIAVADAYPGSNADQLLVAAREAFVAGLGRAGALSTGLALLCLVIAFLMIPHTLSSNRGEDQA